MIPPLLVTVAWGIIIFVDDYFNCLTVGTVMRSITDKNRISREKLAHIIDSTAAPICIIAPISSWVAAVTLVSYAVGGVIGNSVVGLVLGIVLLSVGVVVLKMRDKSNAKAYVAEAKTVLQRSV